MNNEEYFANTPVLQLTLRELHSIITNPSFWIGLAAVIMILTVAGPFDTLNELTFAPRLVYWASVSFITFFLGIFFNVLIGTWLYQRGWTEWLARLVGGAVSGVPISVVVWSVNSFIFLNDEGTGPDFIRLLGYCIPIAMAVSLIYYLVELNNRSVRSAALTQTEPLQTQPPTAKVDSPFFARIPVSLGRDVISLNAQDHYIKVVTTKGSEMILMRLSDAETELGDLNGIRTHRSWWVSRNHITETIRENGKITLKLSDGTLVPVSRSYKAALI